MMSGTSCAKEKAKTNDIRFCVNPFVSNQVQSVRISTCQISCTSFNKSSPFGKTDIEIVYEFNDFFLQSSMPIISFLALSWDDIFVVDCKQSGLRKSERIRITSDVVPHPDFETRICLQIKGFLQIRVHGRSQRRHRQTLNRTPAECYLFPFRLHSAASGTLSSLRTTFRTKK